MGRPTTYKILEHIADNLPEGKWYVNEIIEALKYYAVTAGMEKEELGMGLNYLSNYFWEYVDGDKKDIAEELRLMS